MKKEARKIKHIDPVVNSIQNFSLDVANTLSNIHNNPRPSVVTEYKDSLWNKISV